MHPGNDTYALLVVVGSQHYLLYFLRAVGCALIYNLYGDVATLVQTINHLLGVSINCNYCIASVQELCTSHPPNLIILKCFHCYCFVFLFINVFVLFVRSRRWGRAYACNASQ